MRVEDSRIDKGEDDESTGPTNLRETMVGRDILES